MKALFGIFFQPGKVFAELSERSGAWILPLALSLILLVASSWLALHYIGMETIVRQQLEQVRLSPEQMQQAMARASSPGQAWASYIGTAVVGALGMLVIAGVLYVFGLMTKREPAFPAMLAMVALAVFPYALVTFIMKALIIAATPDRTTLDVNNLIATNAAAYMNRSTMAKGMYALLTSLDLLSFLEIGLLALGFSRLTRVGYFSGLAAVGGLWVLFLSCKMAVSLLF